MRSLSPDLSIDYVFDGTSPPYVPSAQPNPVNLYGITKRDAELAVLGVEGAHVIVLRVPVLYVLSPLPSMAIVCPSNSCSKHRRYGPAPSNADSAINILVDVVRDQSGKKYTMDHYQTRFPTNVLDIASFLVRLASMNSSLLLDIPGLTPDNGLFTPFSLFVSQIDPKAHGCPR